MEVGCVCNLSAIPVPGTFLRAAAISSPISSVQSLSHAELFATPWTVAHQASLSITNSWSLFKLMSIESVMPSNHHILCCPLLLPPSIFPSIRVFFKESVLHIRWPNYWSFSFNISFPGGPVVNTLDFYCMGAWVRGCSCLPLSSAEILF